VKLPNISVIPVDLYQPLDAYNHLVDNRPLLGLVGQINIINSAVDNNSNTLLNCIGTAGSLDNRLNQSLNPDGSLITVAIDNALHNIAEHMDDSTYCRMTMAERAKISLIANDATNFGLQFNTISGIIGFDQGFLTINPSDTITWRYDGYSMYADNDFPSAVRHIHYYDITPVPVNLIVPDYIHYSTTSISTPYQEGSLRVYLNGIRLSQNAPVGVPVGMSTLPYKFSEDESSVVDGMVTSGLFSLSSAINSGVVIAIDFDVLYS
jgi:hypothetical protein